MPFVIPVLAFGAAYALIKGSQSGDAAPDTPDSPDDPAANTAESTEPNTGSAPVSTSGINWQPIIEEMRGDIPADFLNRWIARESGGNPCSKGAWGGPWEAGIGQVYFDRDQRNTAQFGVTLDQLRACCVTDSQALARQPTDEEMRAQVSSLVAMAAKYVTLASSRIQWSESDTLCLAKLYHALPVLVTTHLSVAVNDGMADNWNAYRNYLGTMTRDELLEIDVRAGYKPGHGAAPYWPIDRLFNNAQLTGRGY